MDLASELREHVGDKYVLGSPDEKAPYLTDRSGRLTGAAQVVVLPGDTGEVAAAVACCERHGVSVVPQGGNTGLAGGGVPESGSVVISLERLRDVAPVDPYTSTVIAGAGVTLAELDDHVGGAGLFFPIDHAARSAATVGGTIATNAGGALAWRFGMARSCVVAVEVVLAGGRVLTGLDRPLKNNSGLDLTGLMCGSEGTLGVVTRARLRLVPASPRRVTALLPLSALSEIAQVFAGLRDRCPSLLAVDFMSAEALDLVRSFADLPAAPFDAPIYLCVECGAVEDPTDQLGAALSDLGLMKNAVAQDGEGRRRLWAYRELLNDAVTASGGHKMDIALPLTGLGDFLTAVNDQVSEIAPSARTVWFGHAGDGNVHLNVLDGHEHRDAIEERVYKKVAAAGGSISAEHGIGRLKTRWLDLARSQEEIDAMRSIKQALDPHGMMNPGVMFTS